MLHKKAFTLIELLLLVSLVSFITISSFSGFLVSSERLEFQNQSTNIQNFLTTHRSQAFSNNQNNIQYQIEVSPSQIQKYTTNTETQNQANQETINFQEPIQIQEFNAKPLTQSNWTDSNQNFTINISSSTRKCQITSPDQPDTQFTILEIPIYKTDTSTPSKYIYIHRENCLIETLNNQIHN